MTLFPSASSRLITRKRTAARGGAALAALGAALTLPLIDRVAAQPGGPSSSAVAPTPAAFAAAAAAQGRPTGAPSPAAAPAVPAATFRNVAHAAGVDFVLQQHPTPEKHLIETVPGGVAAFDYNNDGRVDLFFANGAASPSLQKQSAADWNRLYRNDGGMRFTDVTKAAGLAGIGYAMGAAAADFDNDGFTDLFVAGVRENRLYRNTGNGTFEDVTMRAGVANRGEWAVAGGWFDYDNDGLLDLFVVNYVKWTPSFSRVCGDEARHLRVYCHPRYFEGLANRLFHNRGDGTFEDVSERSGIGGSGSVGKGMSVAFADYDEDGFMDAFVTNDGVPNFLFHNRGDGTFEEVGLLAGVAVPMHGKAVSSMGVDFQDYDNDGRPDIQVTALSAETFPLYHNDGHGTFSDATQTSRLATLTRRLAGWSTALIDLNNDGWKDIFAANAHVNDRIESFEASTYKQANSVLLNLGNGSGQFRDGTAEAGPELQASLQAHRGAAFADFNGDGRIDIAVSALGGAAELWENTTPGARHWIVLQLEGMRSNRSAIGARITITVGGPSQNPNPSRQTRTVSAAVGYASTSDVRAHFGLGDRASTIDRIEIKWPSGIRQMLEGVSVDQVLKVKEPNR